MVSQCHCRRAQLERRLAHRPQLSRHGDDAVALVVPQPAGDEDRLADCETTRRASESAVCDHAVSLPVLAVR